MSAPSARRPRWFRSLATLLPLLMAVLLFLAARGEGEPVTGHSDRDCIGGWDYKQVCNRFACWNPVQECKTERDCSGAGWKCVEYRTVPGYCNTLEYECVYGGNCWCRPSRRVCARGITVPCTEKEVCREVMRKSTCTECRNERVWDPCERRKHRNHTPTPRPTPTATPVPDSRQIGEGGDDSYTGGDFNTCLPDQIWTGESCQVPGTNPGGKECACGSYCEDNGRSCWCNICSIGGNPTPTPVPPVYTPTPTATLTLIPTATPRTEDRPNPTATPTRDRPRATATPRPRPTATPRTGEQVVLVPPPTATPTPESEPLLVPPPPVEWDAQDVRGAPVITGRLVQRADRLLMTAQGGRAADTRYNLTWARPHTVFTHPDTGAQWFVARPVRRIAVGACPARMSAGSDCRRLRSRYTLLAPSAVAGWPGAAAALGRAADRAARSALGIDLGRIPPGDAATAYCSTAEPPPLQAANRTLAALLDGEEGAPGQWDGGLQMTLAALPADACAPDMPPAGHALTEADTLTAFPPAMQVVIWAGTVASGE